MTKKFCVHDLDKTAIVNIKGDSENEIKMKLLEYIFLNFDIDNIDEILDRYDITYSEIEEEIDYE